MEKEMVVLEMDVQQEHDSNCSITIAGSMQVIVPARRHTANAQRADYHKHTSFADPSYADPETK